MNVLYLCSPPFFHPSSSKHQMLYPLTHHKNVFNHFKCPHHHRSELSIQFWNLMPSTKKEISYKLLNIYCIINQHWLGQHLVQHQVFLSLFPLRCQFLVSISYWKATHYSWITGSTKKSCYSLRHLFMHQKCKHYKNFLYWNQMVIWAQVQWEFWNNSIHVTSGLKASPS